MSLLHLSLSTQSLLLPILLSVLPSNPSIGTLVYKRTSTSLEILPPSSLLKICPVVSLNWKQRTAICELKQRNTSTIARYPAKAWMRSTGYMTRDIIICHRVARPTSPHILPWNSPSIPDGERGTSSLTTSFNPQTSRS